MKTIHNSSQAIANGYPVATGRLKQIVGPEAGNTKKIALLGDSTLDNGFWVQKKSKYSEKTHTVTHQIARALANSPNDTASYELANFAVDGATTADLMAFCPLNKVIPADADHPARLVHQLSGVANWQPDIAVVSVGGNNYREALQGVLRKNLSSFQLLFRVTPERARPTIKDVFREVKRKLIEEYKEIIDNLINQNPKLNRIVLLSQYYPALTDFTPYFIYAGFSHLARSEGKGQTPFALVEETMNDLYRHALQYAATKNKELVFVDVTSSLNPLGGNHTRQIEPNEHGAKIMGQLIAKAVEYKFPVAEKSKVLLRMSPDGLVHSKILEEQNMQQFKVKKIERFIRENRYRHVGLFFSASSSLDERYVHGYELVMGKQFDTEYRGLFAFGLLDLSLITIMASYLWRVALNEKIHSSLRIAAGAVAAPILLSKMIIGLSLMLALALPIYGYHQVATCFNERDEVAQVENRMNF